MGRIVSAKEAFEYAKTHYPTFPSDWLISIHFTWNDVFVNELKSDGIPSLDIFNNAVRMSVQLEKIRVRLGKPITVHCWYRSMAHNLRLKAQGYKPAMHSAHLYAMAVDYNVAGWTEAQVRTALLNEVHIGNLQVRIEANTVGWVHCDIGSVYLNNYKWGIFNP